MTSADIFISRGLRIVTCAVAGVPARDHTNSQMQAVAIHALVSTVRLYAVIVKKKLSSKKYCSFIQELK
jgi:hypothetical protein